MSKKNDDIILEGEEEQAFEFSQEDEISVQKPGLLEKRGAKKESRVVESEGAEHFDIT